MRIALFTETFLPHVDGIVTRLRHTLDELGRAGDDVLVVAPEAPGRPSHDAGARVVGVPSLPLPLYPDFRLGLPLRGGSVYRILDDFAPDIVHAVTPFSVGILALAYAARRRIPVLASYHTNLAAYARRYHLGPCERPAWAYLRLLHNHARLTLCTSRATQALLQRAGIRRVRLWPPGVDGTLFHPGRRSTAWRMRVTGGRPATTILLSVGRLAAEKELDRLLAALPGLADAHTVIVGSGPLAGALRRSAAGLPVTFLGSLRGAALAEAYASADVFVLPSATETLGLVAIEAMAAGLPVVGARRGGIPEVVVDDETGLLFDPDVPGELARALRSLASSPQERTRLGDAARRRAATWSWGAATRELRRHYAHLMLNTDQ